jgi:hypothetical protein
MNQQAERPPSESQQELTRGLLSPVRKSPPLPPFLIAHVQNSGREAVIQKRRQLR